ncbi:hypothetical protein PSN45_000868 [Yamadazyma tenuis]|uniref:Uncharacterized protein n=1 Tax=Candida tenuis (strain ATCC 10573 / BCRC 21748 / CBS 615 / JCM 9827 / NBRC 10315 / NRRL Y-1498 / VKM Y-70) TaxID=590646 RepID=G3BB57_CANTC|nr:uncharacterized protein CANTEDRAFT_95038 [Yamadazyma tenuis ATCC 10573]EGV62145.1 hypothetical protein CANTEDRAFT_95038 [Yamadazyma tenuis ATCC 10573]WEJ93405.1 hypothetical protein PSN45_000868 [Yamadazyma tenuis]
MSGEILRSNPNQANMSPGLHMDKVSISTVRPDSAQKNGAKRAAQSPITPSLRQSTTRRKINTKSVLEKDPVMWTIEYEGWKLRMQMERNMAIREFREMEMHFEDL